TQIEDILYKEILEHLEALKEDEYVILKLSIPSETNLYKGFTEHPNVIRVVALSGGYSTNEANQKLKQNEGVIASFSRALTQDLNVDQSDDQFNKTLKNAVRSIYKASI